MRIILLAGAAMVLGVLLLSTCCFAVDRAEFVYLTQFGRQVQTYDGETDAGLHFKWPWPIQAIQRLDHRLQVFDLPGAELLTHDPKGMTIDKTLTIGAYVCWRIADREGVDRFIRTVGSPNRAEAILGQRISSRLGAEIGIMKLEDLISVASTRQAEERMDRLSMRLLTRAGLEEQDTAGENSLREEARRNYGVEIVDIRLRRFNYPSQVRDAIFDRIRSERNKKAADYQSEGRQLAADITSQADYEARTMLAKARAEEQIVRGKAEADADRIRNQAQAKDAAFYAFLKKLNEYQRILGDGRTVLLLSSQRDLFDLLFKPPSPEKAPVVPSPASAAAGMAKQPAKGDRQ
jgi:membrane protease subunit HflC